MWVKLSHEDLNPSLCPSHPTSTYTCGVTIVQMCVVVEIDSTIKGSNVYLEAKEEKGKKSIHKIFYSYISRWARNLFALLKKKNC